MAFALSAGKLFALEDTGEFEDTIISKCVDTYIALSASQDSSFTPSDDSQQSLQLSTAFANAPEGATNTSASLTSPTTPFSHSALPSRSLLSRENTASLEAIPTELDAQLAARPESIILKRGLKKQLQRVIEQIFEQCLLAKRYRQVVGIAIEARNLDVLRRVIKRAGEDEKKENGEATHHGKDLMDYILDVCMSIVQEKKLRDEVGANLLEAV